MAERTSGAAGGGIKGDPVFEIAAVAAAHWRVSLGAGAKRPFEVGFEAGRAAAECGYQNAVRRAVLEGDAGAFANGRVGEQGWQGRFEDWTKGERMARARLDFVLRRVT